MRRNNSHDTLGSISRDDIILSALMKSTAALPPTNNNNSVGQRTIPLGGDDSMYGNYCWKK